MFDIFLYMDDMFDGFVWAMSYVHRIGVTCLSDIGVVSHEALYAKSYVLPICVMWVF